MRNVCGIWRLNGELSLSRQRPVLLIMGRSADLSVMVQHAWTYCALCHDLLDMRSNRVTIYEANDSGGPKTPKTYTVRPRPRPNPRPRPKSCPHRTPHSC